MLADGAKKLEAAGVDFIVMPCNTAHMFSDDVKAEINIPFIDIHEDVFQKETNKLKLFPFEKPGHYNEYGYYKVATAIYNFIVNNNN